MVERGKNLLSRCYVGLVLVFLYVPILVLIVLSFNSARSRVIWGGFTLEWYRALFANSQIMEALRTTLLLALLSAMVATVLGTLGALGIHAMRERQYRIMLFCTNIPMVNADIVTGIALMLWFVRFMPLGFGSLLIAHITFNVPYVILSVLPKIRQMNMSVYEAAMDLGANSVYAFFHVLLPQLLGGIVSGFFMAFTVSMDDFVITYFTKGAGVNTLSTMIYAQIRKGIKPEMYALSTLIFGTVFLLLFVANFLPGRGQAQKGREQA